MNRKQLGVWALYDFANSFAAIIFGVYFSQWLVTDHGVSDLKYNLIFIVSSFLLFITAPILGMIVDHSGIKKLPALRWATLGSGVALLGTAVIAAFAQPTHLIINLAIIGLVAAQYFYQLSFVFYNPFLKELGDTTEQAKFSGYGIGAGALGQITALLVTIPLVSGVIYLVGNSGKSQVFLPVTIVFIVLVLPMLFLFKEKNSSRPLRKISIGVAIRSIAGKLTDLGKYPGIYRFLLAYFLFNDAIQTALHNFPIYVERLFSADEQTKALLYVSVILAGGIGAVASGYIAKITGEKRLLISLLIGWVIILPITAAQTNLTIFMVCMGVNGLLLGATASISRAVMTYLAPPSELVHAFSYYAMAERLASFLGPLTWGLVTYTLAGQGIIRYQAALLSLTVFILLGLLVVRKIPSERSLIWQKEGIPVEAS